MPRVTRVDRDGTSWAAALRRGWNIVTYSLPPSAEGTLEGTLMAPTEGLTPCQNKLNGYILPI